MCPVDLHHSSDKFGIDSSAVTVYWVCRMPQLGALFLTPATV